jgi:hypothetical protein
MQEDITNIQQTADTTDLTLWKVRTTFFFNRQNTPTFRITTFLCFARNICLTLSLYITLSGINQFQAFSGCWNKTIKFYPTLFVLEQTACINVLTPLLKNNNCFICFLQMSLLLQKSPSAAVNVSPLKLLHTFPDPSVSIICQYPSGKNNTGFQAIVVQSRSDNHAAFGNLGNCTNSDCVFVQTSERGQCFVKYSESKTKACMSISALVCLIEFFLSTDCTRVESKLKLQIATMREKTALVTVEPGLSFVSSGHCQYEAYFENG